MNFPTRTWVFLKKLAEIIILITQIFYLFVSATTTTAVGENTTTYPRIGECVSSGTQYHRWEDVYFIHWTNQDEWVDRRWSPFWILSIDPCDPNPCYDRFVCDPGPPPICICPVGEICTTTTRPPSPPSTSGKGFERSMVLFSNQVQNKATSIGTRIVYAMYSINRLFIS